MGFILAYLKRGLPLAVAVWSGAFSVQAQGLGPRQGQPILFSSPDSDNVDTTNLPSLTPQVPGSSDLEGIAQAPKNFDFNPLGDALPLPPRPGFSGETAQQQDRRRNWTLLTPAEILGAATPEKMMGIPERNAFGQPKNLTALERYTDRQNQLQLRLAKTNALLAGDSSSAWNFSGDTFAMSNSISGRWRNAETSHNPLFKFASDRHTLSRQNDNNAWSRLFDQPAAMPAPDLAQQADMERFRQLLNPGSSSANPATTSSAEGIRTSLPQTLLDSDLDQPAPNR